jgi:hypothetical protein
MPSIANERSTLAPCLQIDYHSDGEVVTHPLTNGNYQEYSLSRTWVRTPGYRKGLRERTFRRYDLPMNDFSFHKRVVNWARGSAEIVDNDGNSYSVYLGSLYESGLSPTPVPDAINGPPLPYVDLNALSAKASTRALLDLKDQKVNLVQAFAERKQTARLLSDTITRFAAAIKSLKTGNFAAAGKALGVTPSPRRIRKWTKSYSENQSKAIANGWLELQYGWRPMLSDVYGSAELIAQKQIREVRSISRTSASAQLVDRVRRFNQQGYPMFFETTRKVTIKNVIYYSTPSESHTLAQVGITNPLYIAWELTPWSFAVDWLLPIGNYISTLDSTKGLTFEKGCRTFFQEVKVFGKGLSGPTQGGTQSVVNDNEASYLEVSCQRVNLSDFPRTELPRFKNPFGTEHVLNALALLRTSFTLRR